MTNLSLKLQGNKIFLSCSEDSEKEMSRECMVEICQLILGNICSDRDYTKVTSLKKLLNIIQLECEPDESDTEVEESVVQKPVVPVVTATTTKGVRKPPPKKVESEDEEDSD